MDNGVQRSEMLNRIMGGYNGQMGLVNQVLAMNPDNKVATISFAGCSGTYVTSTVNGVVNGYQTGYSVDLLGGWVTGSTNVTNFYTARGGTLYEVGLLKAYEMLHDPAVANDGHRKILVFMSDGEPNAYAEPVYDSVTGQIVDYAYSGTYNDTAVTCEPYIRNVVDWLVNQCPGLSIYTVGVGSSGAMETLLTGMTRNGGSYYQANTANAFVNAMQSIINELMPKGLTITDTLSRYVQLCETQPDMKLMQRDKSGNEVILWRANTLTPNADGSIGTITTDGTDIVDSVTVSGSTITAKLKDEVYIDADHTYTLSFNVELTEAGWNYERNYPNTGDAGTDYGNNATSSGKDGLRSNTRASASYTIDGATKSDAYDYPVVQTAKTAELELNLRKLMDETSTGAAEHPKQRFTILLNGADTNPDGWTQIEPYGDIWIDLGKNATQQDETVTLQFSAEGTYIFTVKEQVDDSADYWDFDTAEYTVSVTVVRDEGDENALTVSSVAITAPEGEENAWRNVQINPAEDSGITPAIPFKNGYWPPQPPEKTWAEDSTVQEGSNVKVGDEIIYEIRYFNHRAEPVTVTVTDDCPPRKFFAYLEWLLLEQKRVLKDNRSEGN